MTTMRDIAREAGVSAMTVSNVINGRQHKVSATTRQRVLDVIAKHNFVLDAAASTLSSKRSDIVALVYPTNPEPLANQHDAAFVGAVEHHVRETGRHLMIWAATEVVETGPKLRTWRVDGAIFYGTLGGEVDDMDDEVTTPIVFVDNYSESSRVNRVGIDDHEGGYLAARHLIEKGHRRLGFVGPLDVPAGVDPRVDAYARDGVVHQRLRGFLAAARDARVEVAEDHVYDTVARFEDGYVRATELSTDERRPTGLFATADILAIGLLNGFRHEQVDVPGEVSLVGFDDIPEAGHVVPGLTTIHQDVGEKARAAVERLVGLIDPGPDPGDHVTLDVQLVERGTVGPPPS